MNTIKWIAIFTLIIHISACNEDDEIKTSDMINNVTVSPSTTLEADGTTIIELTAILNNDLDKRKVIFETTAGTFVDSKDGKSISVDALKINKQLVAVAQIKAPSSPGSITISVQMDLADLRDVYVFKKVIDVNESVPSKLELTASAFNVDNNFEGEIEITGVLKN